MLFRSLSTCLPLLPTQEMAKRNKKATRKIERLRDRLHHVDENPDFKVGWLTQFMFVMDNFDIGETKRANENRWLYTIGPQRRTRYPFETMVIPGTHYTLHWFMQCKISDPTQVPEFKYVPISTGASTLPFGTAPYVPTVQISQTKSDWVVVTQDSYITDAKVVLQTLAKCLNQHNFTIFDARDLMCNLNLSLPLISHEETICELEFLERQRKGIVVSYQNRHKRKYSPVKLEGPSAKRPRLEVTSTSSATRLLLDLLSYGPVSVSNAAQQLRVKEKLIEQVVDVLMVVGQVTVANGFITSTQAFTSMPPSSPTSSLSSCDDSFGPIPETPPQAMPMWDSKDGRQKREDSFSDPSSLSLCSLPSITRSLFPHNPPPPTQPARSRDDRVWTPMDVGVFSVSSCKGSTTNDMCFESNLDLSDSSIVDFFQSSFWDQY